MSDTMTTNTDLWMQFYQQPLDPNLHVSAMEGFCDATVVTSTPSSSPCTPSHTTILSPSSSYTKPKPNSNASKPIRKRSRSSKGTPTTLLNANTTNFRALVQQFTGCPGLASATMSFGVHKGPITLNFQERRRQVVHRNTTRTLTTMTAPVGNTCNYDSQVIHQQPEDQPQLPQDLHQQRIHNNSLMPSMELSDGLFMDHNFSLHDLTMNNAFSNDVKHDGYFM